MGGSGGYIFPSRETDNDSLRQNLQKAQDEENRARFNREVEAILDKQLVKFNDRDTDKIQRYIEDIKTILNTDISGTIDVRFGGSVSKNTYVEGLSDIDSLVLLNNTDYESSTPQEAKDYLYEMLKDRLKEANIRVGALAVTIEYDDYEIQLLPAVKTGTGYAISSPSGEKWSKIKPQAFASEITKVNQSNNNKLVPIIKLAKAIMSNLPENKRLSGYHAEALAVEIFKNYDGEYKKSEMLEHFFSGSAKLVKNPIKDSTQQSYYVDEYLGKAESIDRKRVSDALSRIARQMRNAGTAANTRVWDELIED